MRFGGRMLVPCKEWIAGLGGEATVRTRIFARGYGERVCLGSVDRRRAVLGVFNHYGAHYLCIDVLCV